MGVPNEVVVIKECGRAWRREIRKSDWMYVEVMNGVKDYGFGAGENIDEWMVGNKDVVERYAMKLQALVSVMREQHRQNIWRNGGIM